MAIGRNEILGTLVVTSNGIGIATSGKIWLVLTLFVNAMTNTTFTTIQCAPMEGDTANLALQQLNAHLLLPPWCAMYLTVVHHLEFADAAVASFMIQVQRNVSLSRISMKVAETVVNVWEIPISQCFVVYSLVVRKRDAFVVMDIMVSI